MQRRSNRLSQPFRHAVVTLAILLVTACSSDKSEAPPPTIAPAAAADSPTVTAAPAGTVRPSPVGAFAAVVDPVTRALVVLSADRPDHATVTIIDPNGAQAPVPLPGGATAMTADGPGRVAVAVRGGYAVLDVAARALSRVAVSGREDAEFTAIARRGDGRMVLGDAGGTVYTLAADNTVAASLKIFARVDGIVTQGDTAVVLDRGQTSVTSLNAEGTSADLALRAGDGATTMVADPNGRVLVADTRGGELLVYGVDPLMLRQRYPVPDSPYGLTASGGKKVGLAWVAQTATNTVVGYDLATGIPVEKVRYRTVQQPNTLAFDDASDTLYVVSGTGGGVQVIPGAAR
ncbi:lipoprotein [Mycolicibacterium obuense]|uniref:YncE family protein n=1 Tax=Mycolicibacterium obuense TaxID=1807 RepID=UPI0006535661